MKILKEIKKVVESVVPKDAQISSIDIEGPEIAIYTKNPKIFFDNPNYVSKIAFELKKRINIRADKSILMDPAEAEKKIKDIIPVEADIKAINFQAPFSEVVIEAIKPGLVIGKEGSTSKQIILETGWTPDILRAPTAPSKILTGVRQFLFKHANDRKKFLGKVAENIYRDTPEHKGWVRLTALGGFREVGRSCMLLETPITKVLLDCGINVASYSDPYPYLDALRFPIKELDAIVISHGHLDHHGFVPYLFKLGYRGPVYCTEPTRDEMALMQFDFINVALKEGKEPLFSERDVKEEIKHTITRNYKEVTDIAPDMRLTLYNAAHILGSSIVHMHIGDGAHNLVYTGDLKYGFTRLFNNLDIKYPRIETLISESTYGEKDNVLPPRDQAEAELLKICKDTVDNGGNVLIPVFAVGRAQEVMLTLEEFYRKNQLDAHVYVDGMTKEASAIHTAYPEYLRQKVQRRVLQNDSPFTSPLFQEVEYKERDDILEKGKAIILATSGMMTGGPSVDYFHRMASDEKNALVFVGWQGEGSLGRRLQNGLKELPIKGSDGKTKVLNINMKTHTIEGFSGHSDRNQLLNYIRNLKPAPKRILLAHGEKSVTVNFAKHVANRFRINASALRNLDSVRLR